MVGLISTKIKIFVLSYLIFISPVQASEVINETVNIGLLISQAYGINVEANAKVAISIQVTSGNHVSVYFFDQTNYNKWTGGQSASGLLNKPDIVQGSYTVSLDTAGLYYIILENTDSLPGTSVKVIIDVTSPAESIISTILIVAAVFIGIMVIRAISNSGKPRPAFQQPSSVSPTSKEIQQKYIKCPSCDAMNRFPEDWCASCGINLNK